MAKIYAVKNSAKNRFIRRVLIAFLFSAVLLNAQEAAKIVDIIDTNIFITSSGDTVRLANIETFSIREQDSIKLEFAKKTLKFVTNYIGEDSLLLNVQPFDSLLLVHAWKKKLIAHENVNAILLRKGYAKFLDIPQSEFTVNYKAAEDFAKSRRLGLHNPRAYRPHVPYDSQAFWLQAELGFGLYFLEKSSYLGHYLNANINYRTHRNLFTGGFYHLGMGDCGFTEGPYILAGRSFVDNFAEASISVGLGLPRRIATCADWKFRRRPALVIKSQVFAHARLLAGFGFGLDVSLSRDVSHAIFSLIFALGEWNDKNNHLN